MSSAESVCSSSGELEETPLPGFSPAVEQALKEGKAGDVMDEVNILLC